MVEAVTVTVVVLAQPVLITYDIVAVPIPLPVTTPIDPTDATAGLVLAHTPPGVGSVRVVVPPKHIVVLPIIGAGVGSTVIVRVVAQPVPIVYVTVAVPTLTVVSKPVVGLIGATVVGLTDHVPPGEGQVNVPDAPKHNDDGPVIGEGIALTVTA